MSEVRIRAVIPSIAENCIDLEIQRGALIDSGVEVVVVANGRRLRESAAARNLPVVSSGKNGGFSASIALGAEQVGHWDWLLIVNDDVTIDLERFRQNLQRFVNEDQAAGIVYLNDEAPRPFPTRGAVFNSLSLLGAILTRIRTPSSAPDSRTYRSFSTVAISRSAWEAVGGLDPSMPFTFEDADFVRRATDLGVDSFAVTGSGADHLHSVSTGRHIASVLPVSTHSAIVYLDKWYTGLGLSNRALVAIALLIRIPLSPWTKAPKLPHLVGIARALRVVFGVRPKLPPFEDL
ncbi:MAG: hypothetical protein P1U38_15795 [Aeromicrobium sp.]|uniref:glycosyltransferase family 2 protein n=1 Tax=Aeromicrobium sp. TaxID=1871063 RepID=UPI00261447F0|nr:NTP transferase domain-containing protein [Aeromicrobium sp.]MDF1706231.1 hypothetical protein [Aeromicrobium sp.]